MDDMSRARFTAREDARRILTERIADQRRILSDPDAFTTIDPRYLIDDAVWRLRWLDCAPDGANHLIASMQGHYGIPLGRRGGYDVGPDRELRERYEQRHGRPFAQAMAAAHEAAQ